MTKQRNRNLFTVFSCVLALAFAVATYFAPATYFASAESNETQADYYNAYIDEIAPNILDNTEVVNIPLGTNDDMNFHPCGSFTPTTTASYVFFAVAPFANNVTGITPSVNVQLRYRVGESDTYTTIFNQPINYATQDSQLSTFNVYLQAGSTYHFDFRKSRTNTYTANLAFAYVWGLEDTSYIFQQAFANNFFVFATYKVAYARGSTTAEEVGYLRGYLEGFDKGRYETAFPFASLNARASVLTGYDENYAPIYTPISVTYDKYGMYFENFPQTAYVDDVSGMYDLRIEFDDYVTPLTMGILNGSFRVGCKPLATGTDVLGYYYSIPNVFLLFGGDFYVDDVGRGRLLYSATGETANALYLPVALVDDGLTNTTARTRSMSLQCADYSALKSLYLSRDVQTHADLNNTYRDGYNVGYSKGNSAGYVRGYNEGIQGSDHTFFGLISAVVEAPVKTFTSLFNFDILGYNMAQFMKNIFTVLVFVFVVKWVVSL